ncbi:MAG: CopG family transcriptional regulator [Pseudomonadota bacterium]
MKTKRVSKKSDEAKTIRASISFPADVYAELERIAGANKVSLAWVVRQAVEEYVRDAEAAGKKTIANTNK